MTALELDDVSKHYPGDPPVRSLDGVSLRVDAGDLVTIVGPSGSGKSTLLTVMGTLERPSAGRVTVAGADTSGMSDSSLSGLRAWSIGFVFQAFHLLEGMSAVDNVAAGLLYRGLPAGERRRHAVAALERVGMGHRAHHEPSRLSGGERQRVAIARAVAGRPAIVLADEPTGNLDTAGGNGIIDLLFDLNRDGATIVVVTHNVTISERFARRIALQDGRVVGSA